MAVALLALGGRWIGGVDGSVFYGVLTMVVPGLSGLALLRRDGGPERLVQLGIWSVAALLAALMLAAPAAAFRAPKKGGEIEFLAWPAKRDAWWSSGGLIARSDSNGEDLAGLTKAVGAFPFAKGSKDAALLARLPAGQFTLQISSANTGTGVGLVELYEIDRGIGRTLNLSTRGLVHAGEELMIGGVVVRGPAPKRLLNAPPRRRARRASARGSPAARTPRAGPSPAPGSAADASRQARREKSFPRRRPPG